MIAVWVTYLGVDMKIVINSWYGGYSLSEKAIFKLAELKGITLYPERNKRLGFTTYWIVPEDDELRKLILTGGNFYNASFEDRVRSNKLYDKLTLNTTFGDRSDPDLILTVEELGPHANGQFSDLKVVEIPDGVEWEIEENDGMEWIAEKHRTWS